MIIMIIAIIIIILMIIIIMTMIMITIIILIKQVVGTGFGFPCSAIPGPMTNVHAANLLAQNSPYLCRPNAADKSAVRRQHA